MLEDDPALNELSKAAPAFAALGDPVRLAMVAQLCKEGPLPTVALKEGMHVTRQGLTKHLNVLEDAAPRQQRAVWARPAMADAGAAARGCAQPSRPDFGSMGPAAAAAEGACRRRRVNQSPFKSGDRLAWRASSCDLSADDRPFPAAADRRGAACAAFGAGRALRRGPGRPAGAGKTTRVPLALLDEPLAKGGRIILLEPRRLPHAPRRRAWLRRSARRSARPSACACA